MANERVVTELVVDARGATAGSAEYVRAMNAAQRAVDASLAREERLKKAMDETAGALGGGVASISKRAQQWDKLAASLDPVIAAEQKAAKAIREATLIADAGTRLLGKSQEEAALLVGKVTQQQLAYVEAAKKVAAENAALAKSSGLARHELINLGRQAQDVAVSLQSGQGLFTVLFQQGSQIADVFASSRTGTVKGFFQQVGESLASVITPARLAGAAMLAASALVVFSVSRWNDSQRELTRSLYGTGLAAGVTQKQLTDMAEAGARASGVATSAARETLAVLANTGRIDPRLMPQLVGTSRNIQATLSMEAADANNLLAQSLKSPADGYKRLTDALGGYDAVLARELKNLEAAGKLYEAQARVLPEIERRLAPLSEVTSQWARAWNAVRAAVSQVLDDIAKITGGSLGRFMDAWVQYQQRVEGAGGGFLGARRVAAQDNATAEVTNLRNAIAEADRQLADLRRRASETTDASRRAYMERLIVGREQEIRGYEQQLEVAQRRVQQIDDGMRQVQSRVARSPEGIRGSLADASNVGRLVGESQPGLEQGLQRRAQAMRDAATAQRDLNEGLEVSERLQTPANEAMRRATSYVNDYQRAWAAYQAEMQGARRPHILAELKETYESTRDALQNMTREGTVLFDQQGRLTASNEQLLASLRPVNEAYQQRRNLERNVASAEASGNEQRILRARRQLDEFMQAQRGPEAGTNAQRQLTVQNNQLDAIQATTDALSRQRIERERATQDAVDQINAETRMLGLGTAAQDGARHSLQLFLQARAEYRRTGREMPQEEIDFYNRLGDAITRAKQAQAERRALLDISFERQIIGMGDGEAQIARNLRSIYGDEGWRQQMNGTLAEQARFNNNLKDASDLAKGFGSDLLGALRNGKSGFDALIEAASKFTAKLADKGMDRFIEMSLRGENPLTFSGTLGNTLGLGNFSGVLGLSPSKFFSGIQNAVSGGTTSGYIDMWGRGAVSAGEAGIGGGFNMSQGVGAGLQIGGAALGAYAAGRQGGPIAGALSGAMAGFQLGGPIGAAIGGLIGAVSGALRGNPERDKAAQNWRMNKPETDLYVAQLNGRVAGSLGTSFAQETKKVLQLSNEASMARESEATWKAMEAALWKFKIDTSLRFLEPFNNMLDALESGLGSNSPIAQAHQAVQTLREEMLKFIDDTETAAKTVSADAGSLVGQAQRAAQAYALTLLTGAEEQTVVRKEFDRLNQTAISLQKVLVDLGMTSAQAAAAISENLTFALAKLKNDSEKGLLRRYYSASGMGYLNEIQDAMEQWAKDSADAQILGIKQGFVDNTNLAEIQKIITGADLSAEAFDALIAKFPQLEGVVRRAASSLEDILARQQGYLDRYFNATNDNSTLEGQLRAFERQAARDREEEIKAGGEAMAELEMALAAERLKIVMDFGKQQKQVLEQAQESYLSFVRRIKEFTDGLRAGAQSPLSPADRLAAAQSQYNAQLTLAQGGNRDALNGITSYASDLLEAAKAYYASSTAFQTIFTNTVGQLEALPTQVSAEQFIVNAINAASANQISAIELMRLTLNSSIATGSASAIASALQGYFLELDSSMDGAIDFNEMVAALGSNFSSGTWAAIRTKIDANLDSKISQLEIATYTGSAAAISNALISQFNNVASAAASGITQSQFDTSMTSQGLAKNVNLQALFNEIDTNDNNLIDKSEAIRLASLSTVTNTGTTATNTNTTAGNTGTTANNTNATTNAVGAGNVVSQQIANLQSTATQQLQILNSNFSPIQGSAGYGPFTIGGAANQYVQMTGGALDYLRKITFNTWAISNNTFGLKTFGTNVIGTYGSGGRIDGPSHANGGVLINAEGGEFMLRRSAASALAPFLDDLNRGRLPVMPVPMAGNDNSTRALLSEIQALRAEVAALRSDTRQGAALVGQAVVAVKESVDVGVSMASDTNKEARRLKAKAA